MKKQDVIILSILIVSLVLIRAIFNIPNFNPLGAVALMGGVLFGKNIRAYVVPMGALLAGDIIMGLSSPLYSEYIFSISFLMVYLSFALIIGLGMSIANKPSLTKVLGGSLLAAGVFFLVSNAGSWLALEMYPKSFTGLIAAYEAGVPFFRSTLVSQVLFSLGIYVVYSLATNKKVALA